MSALWSQPTGDQTFARGGVLGVYHLYAINPKGGYQCSTLLPFTHRRQPGSPVPYGQSGVPPYKYVLNLTIKTEGEANLRVPFSN